MELVCVVGVCSAQTIAYRSISINAVIANIVVTVSYLLVAAIDANNSVIILWP